MLPAPSRYYTVHDQSPPPLLRGKALRPLSAGEFTESCERLLALAQQHSCPFWLLDGRADLPQPFDVYEWLRDEYLPRVHKALERVPCLAFVARPELWRGLQAHGYAPPAPRVLSAAFRANWFTEEAAALAWLAQFRPTIGLA